VTYATVPGATLPAASDPHAGRLPFVATASDTEYTSFNADGDESWPTHPIVAPGKSALIAAPHTIARFVMGHILRAAGVVIIQAPLKMSTRSSNGRPVAETAAT
jgi:hypothetical protein